MDLELRISQYIDGELSGEEEAELHHMLAVSPEARALFREHLTLHTIARDERVLQRPEQSMRDSLFARLQAEEGMKSSAVLLGSVGAGVAALSVTDSAVSETERRVAQDRPPIASEVDPRTEERRRRRRLIPILIPLLLCVIVGGIWYSGGFGGDGDSGAYTIAGNDVKKNPSAAASDGDYTERAEIPNAGPTVDSSIPNRSLSIPPSPPLADASELNRRSSFPTGSRSSAGRALRPEQESFALNSEGIEEEHNVLGISSSSKENMEARASDPQMDFGYDGREDLSARDVSPNANASVDKPALSYDDAAVWGANAERDFLPPLENEMGITLVPESATMSEPLFADQKRLPFNSSTDGFVLADTGSSVRLNEVAVNNDFTSSTMMYNSISAPTILGGSVYDTATGLRITPTMENYEQIAAVLASQGLNTEGDADETALTEWARVNGGNTGSRSINEGFTLGGGSALVADGSAREKGNGAAPVVMGYNTSGKVNDEGERKHLQSDSLQVAAAQLNDELNEQREITITSKAPAVKKESNNAEPVAVMESSFKDAPLDPSTPRRINFFVGLDQSIGATVTSMEVTLPFPTSSFSSFPDNGGLSSETRILFGVDFDRGRQKVFAVIGAWGYDERESIKNREISHAVTSNGVVNSVTTTVSRQERTAYEVWGGAGYRYTISMSRNLGAGAEVWAGVGGEYIQAGLSIPFSYRLRENLHLEVSPGIRYRDLHSTAEQVTTGTPASGSFEERIVTPKDDHRVEAAARIGLILLFR